MHFLGHELPYLLVATTGMERGTLIQCLKVVVICEENSTNVDDNRVILNIYPMMKGEKKKVEKNSANANIARNPTTQKISVFGTLITWRTN
jgi:hypothetical protein